MRNRHPGKCLRCGRHVGPGQGFFEKKHGAKLHRGKGKWAVRCYGCVNRGHTRPEAAATLTVNWKSRSGKTDYEAPVLFEKIDGKWTYLGSPGSDLNLCGNPDEIQEQLNTLRAVSYRWTYRRSF